MVAPSVLPCHKQDACMRELCQELARCMARASLQSETRSSSRGQRLLCSCSALQTQYPSAGPWGVESANQPNEDTPAAWLQPRWHSQRRNRSRQHQSPSPSGPSQCQLPSPSPPQSHPVNEWLNCSMEHLDLQTRPQKSRSRAWWNDASTPAEEKLKKQFRFKVDEELDDDPMLPLGLTLWPQSEMTLQGHPLQCMGIPHDLSLVKATQTAPPIEQGSGLKSQPNHPLVNANQGQTQWTIPVGRSMLKWRRSSTPTSGRN